MKILDRVREKVGAHWVKSANTEFKRLFPKYVGSEKDRTFWRYVAKVGESHPFYPVLQSLASESNSEVFTINEVVEGASNA